MVTKTKKRKSTDTKKRFIAKRNGQIEERVQATGPEHFGIESVESVNLILVAQILVARKFPRNHRRRWKIQFPSAPN